MRHLHLSALTCTLQTGFDVLLAQTPDKLLQWPLVPGMGQLNVMGLTEVEGLQKKTGGAAAAGRRPAA
jgi:hypothetical protein